MIPAGASPARGAPPPGAAAESAAGCAPAPPALYAANAETGATGGGPASAACAWTIPRQSRSAHQHARVAN